MVTPSGPLNHGGVERHVREVSSRLLAMGHAVSVVCADPSGETVGVSVVDGVTVTTVAAWPKHRDWRFAPAVWRAVREARCDLVHVQSYHTFVAPIAMAAALRSRVPFVLTFHGGGHSERWRNHIRVAHRALLRPLLRRAAKLIAVAQFEISEYGRELHMSPERFVLIPNGTDLTVVPTADERDQSDQREVVIATIGRLERYKGHHRVLAAMPALLRVEPGARLLVVGVGPYEDDLRAQAATLGVSEHVEFTSVPAGDGEGMGRLLSGVDVVVLLSEFETHPLAALEAAAAHRRLIVADRGGLIELAQDGLARAVPLDLAPAEIAATVLEVLAEPPPTGEVRLTTWNDCAQSLADLYLEVVRTPS
jgi:glycosyltransferase involved in cell wall biosynthesis